MNKVPGYSSDEWLAESRKIREEYRDRVPKIPVTVRMNQIINDVPFGDGVILAHVDTSSGQLDIDIGHLESPDLTVTLNYDTAKAILIDGDARGSHERLPWANRKVDGDHHQDARLAAGAAGSSSDPGAAELVKRIQAITVAITTSRQPFAPGSEAHIETGGDAASGWGSLGRLRPPSSKRRYRRHVDDENIAPSAGDYLNRRVDHEMVPCVGTYR